MDASASTFRRCCRTCMLQGHNFHSFSDYADNTKIDEMLAMVVPQLLIISTEPLPTQLCAVCLNTLHSAFKFQQMCIASEKSLRNILCTDFCTSLPGTSTSTTMGQQERNPVLEEQFIKIESDDLAEKSFENIEPVDVSTTHPSAIEATSQEKDPLLEENFIKCENYEMMETNIESESDAARDVSGADKECRDSLKATGVVDVESSTSQNKRTTDRDNANLANVVRAIRSILLDKITIRAAARAYNLPRTTLQRHLEKVTAKYKDISTVTDEKLHEIIKRLGTYAARSVKQVFSAEEEEVLVGYAKQFCDCFYGLSIVQLKELAYQFAKKIRAKYPPNWDAYEMSGRDWYNEFIRRQQSLSLKSSLNRSQSFSKENVQLFFRNLNSILTHHLFTAADIWNMDETGYSTEPTKIGEVLLLRDMKRLGKINDQEQENMVTMALAINAEGKSIPPFFSFPSQNIKFANFSGRMRQTEFLKYTQYFIDRTNSSQKSPKLLLLDNHGSNLSIEVLDLAAKNGVTFLSFPPHCSHRLQPLDVGVYDHVKTYYKSQCIAWQKNFAGQLMEIQHITDLVRSSLDLALTPKNIKAGFLATGIAPLNPDIFVDSDFLQAVLSGDNFPAAADVEVKDEELQRRKAVFDVRLHEGNVNNLEQAIQLSPKVTHTSNMQNEIGVDEIENLEQATQLSPEVTKVTHTSNMQNEIGVDEIENLQQATQLSPKVTKVTHTSNMQNEIGVDEIEKPNLDNRRKITLHCPDCDRVFDRPYRLKRHVGVHDENRRFMCEVCEYRFAAANQLARHKLTHADAREPPPEGYKCAECPRRFEKRESLSAHIQSHRKTDSGELFQCNICHKKFRERTILAKHARTHPENQKFKCTECDKTFGLNEHLIQHMNKHKGLKPFICAFCDKGFDLKCHLKAHESTHTGEKPFLCAQCGKSFKTMANLNQHLPRHSGERRYQCPECPSKFICQSDQIKHTSTHRALKPHVCDTCGSRFTRSTTLTKHKIIHTGERPHKCKECSMTFAFKNHIRRHMRTHTGERPHKCKFCDRAYSASGDLNKHLRTHVGEKTYQCEQCPEAFKYHLELREHQRQHFKQQKATNELTDDTNTEKEES